MVPSTAPRSCRLGRNTDRPRRFESSSLGQYCPGNAGKLVGERYRQHVVVEPFLCGLDPQLEPVTFPAHRLDENDPRGLHEQHAQIAISPLRDHAQDRAISRRDLLWHEPEPSREVASLREHVTGADRGDHRARDDRADPRYAHEAVAARILPGNRLDLAREGLDALAEAPEICTTRSGVYVIRDSIGTRRVGQENPLPARLGANRRAQTLLEAVGARIHWAAVATADLAGVEAYLGRMMRPRDAERFPDVPPIPVNLPFADNIGALALLQPHGNALTRGPLDGYNLSALTSPRNRLLP
jgi:hypothetical protein